MLMSKVKMGWVLLRFFETVCICRYSLKFIFDFLTYIFFKFVDEFGDKYIYPGKLTSRDGHNVAQYVCV